MTVHEQFRQRRVKLLKGIAASFVLFAAASSLANKHPSPILVALILLAFAGFGVCTILINFACKCPRCRKCIIAINTPDTSFLSFPRYCGHCGLDFESVDADTPPI